MKSKLIIFLATVSFFVCITFQGNGQKVMAASQNDYPIVLVHGLAGWDRNEALGFKYWGGLYDIQEILKQKGYPTMTAAVGPFASNWDRTAELYAYIMGGTVDYGAAHAAKENMQGSEKHTQESTNSGATRTSFTSSVIAWVA
uniref:esterase/lipase family protein n=1 Tax=Listeria booriae TaxID=1552123 RepID=UPI0016253B3E|nr:hypothetical protein [Listeria booriae]